MQTLLLTAVCLATVACSRGEPSNLVNIFGPDNRETPPNAAPYNAVGRLDSGCTGTLVGDRLVLTAAHCVVDNGTGKVKAGLTYFRPNLRDGKSDETVWIKEAWIGTDKPEDERLSDWAFLLLEDAVGPKYGHLPVQEVDFKAQLPFTTNLVGYSADRNKGDDPSLSRGCYVHEIVDGKLFHDCDGTGGVSGGPLLNQLNNVWTVVGVTVSEYRQGAADSVTRDGYSRDYANVAVPSSQFTKTATALLASVDKGQAAPTLEGVVDHVNTNTKPAENPTPPTQPQTPWPYSPAQIVAQSRLRQQASALEQAMRQLQQQVIGLKNWAAQTGNQPLVDRAAAMNTAVDAWDLAFDRVVGQGLATNYSMVVYDGYNGIKAGQASLRELAGQGQTQGQASWQLGDTLLRIDQTILQLEAIVFQR